MNVFPEFLYRARQVRELDRRAIEDHGIAGFSLMQRAAKAGFSALQKHWPDARRLHVVCGPGNNGGDGFLLATLALAQDYQVTLELHGNPQQLTGDAKLACQSFSDAGGRVVTSDFPVMDAEVIVDALLGTGTSRQLTGAFRLAVERIKAAHAGGSAVISMDIPSGLNADTGAVLGVAVNADVTVSFIGLKPGLLTGAGPAHAGHLVFSDLEVPAGIYADMPAAAQVIQNDLGRRWLPPRARDAHKNRHGHVLCVGGDYGTSGAIRLAAEAALRAGAGLVSVATRPDTAIAMSQSCPELMCAGVQSPDELDPLLERADVVLLGPGLGQGDWGKALWTKVMGCRSPLVLDADALNLLAGNPQKRDNWVLTPHPGEASRLLQMDKPAVQADRFAAVSSLARQFSAVTLLKGAGTLITGENSPLYLCAQGNPGMAVGGMGDLLGGVIAAFIAQGIPLLEATTLAVYVHACAGDRAAGSGERGMLPGDLLPHIRQLVNP